MEDFVLGILFCFGCFLYYLHYESFEFLRVSFAAIVYLAFFIWQIKMMPETIRHHKEDKEYGYMLICIAWSLLLIFTTIYIFLFVEW